MKSLTVGKLLKELKNYPEDSLIVMASDPESNRIHTAYKIEPMQVVKSKNWLAVDSQQEENYDPNNPGGNAVYFLALSRVEPEGSKSGKYYDHFAGKAAK